MTNIHDLGVGVLEQLPRTSGGYDWLRRGFGQLVTSWLQCCGLLDVALLTPRVPFSNLTKLL